MNSGMKAEAVRLELSATRLSAGFGQPALDYHLPTSLSSKSGRRDSKPRSRAPTDHAAHGARRAAAALYPGDRFQSERADLNPGTAAQRWSSPGPPPTARVPGRDYQASLRSAASSSCGSRTRLHALKGRDPQTDRRTSHVGAHFSRSGSGGARIRLSWFSARRYTVSATDPNEKSLMSL